MNGKNFGADITHNHDVPTNQEWEAFRAAIAQGIPTSLGDAAYHLKPAQAVLIQSVALSVTHIVVELNDGRALRVPWEWFPILHDANDTERQAWVLDNSRTTIEFPMLATEISLDYILSLPNPDDPVAFAVVSTPPNDRVAVAAALLWHAAQERHWTIEEAMEVLSTALKSRPPLKSHS